MAVFLLFNQTFCENTLWICKLSFRGKSSKVISFVIMETVIWEREQKGFLITRTKPNVPIVPWNKGVCQENHQKSEIIFKGSSSFILINVSQKVSRKNMYRAYWIIKCFLSVYVLVHFFHYMKTDDYAPEIKFY